MNISPLCRNTRPEGQLPPQEQAAFDLLDRLGIDYDRVSHEAAFNMELCADVAAALGVPVCKNLFLCNRQKTQFYLLAMGPDKALIIADLPDAYLVVNVLDVRQGDVETGEAAMPGEVLEAMADAFRFDTV